MTDETEKSVLVITVASHKGGVGKTTTVAQLGAGFSVAANEEIGLVVLVDTDPQGSLGPYLGVGSEDDFSAVILGERSIGECLVKVPSFDNRLQVLRGSGRTWEDVENIFVREKGSPDMEPLSKRLSNMFDLLVDLVKKNEKVLVLVDTAPSFSEIQSATLLVADYVLCPITLDDYGAEQGMISTWEWFQTLEEVVKKDQIFGVLPQKVVDLESPSTKRDTRRAELIVGKRRVLPGIPFSEQIGGLTYLGQTIWTSKEMKDSLVNSQYAMVMDNIANALGLGLRWKPEQKKSKRGK